MSCSNCGGCGKASGPLNDCEKALLDELARNAFLPVARFLITNPEDPELSFVMSAPVYLPTLDADSEELKRCGSALLNLRKRGYITLDYGVPLSGFDYEAWKKSDFYDRFAFSVEAPGAVPMLEPGSVALTLQGQDALDEAI